MSHHPRAWLSLGLFLLICSEAQADLVLPRPLFEPVTPAEPPGPNDPEPGAGTATASTTPPLSTGASADPRTPASILVLDLAALARRTPTQEADEEVLSPLLERQKVEQITFPGVIPVPGGDLLVTAYGACDRLNCRGEVVLLTPGLTGQPPRVRSRAPLPLPTHHAWPVTGISFGSPALDDLDGDGQPELLLPYSVEQPPRPALGSLRHHHLAAYNLPALSLVWQHELERNGASVDEHCSWQLELHPANPPTTPTEIIATGHCTQDRCLQDGTDPPDCRTHRELKERWHWQRSADRFIRK